MFEKLTVLSDAWCKAGIVAQNRKEGRNEGGRNEGRQEESEGGRKTGRRQGRKILGRD